MTAFKTYSRGSVIRVDLNPVVGSEQAHVRPCIVVSDAKAVRTSRARLLYVVVPLTRSESLKGPLAPRLGGREGGLPATSTALCMHVRSVDPRRVVGYVGDLNENEYRAVGQGLRALFGLETEGEG